MFYALPPAGQPISLRAGPPAARSPLACFLPWQAQFYASGTAALAAAIGVAVRLRGGSDPQVILPAYGCPDLVSAVLYAGARPVLVDLEPDRPWMDLERLAAQVGAQTVAIVAVSLFGIRERIAAIRAIAERSSALLIEDSAQAFPAASDPVSFWEGDLAVVSFGRGKPVSLLGGGAVLFRDDSYRALLPACPVPAAPSARQRLAFRLKAVLYNLMSAPRAYWLPAGLPMLRLGETRFQPLAAVRCMDAARLELLAANVAAFRGRTLHVQAALAGRIAELAGRSGAVLDLPAACRVPAGHALLRYPVLLAPDVRDRIYKSMKEKGLGASVMYPAALPDIAGLAPYLGTADAVPVARDFAHRILTLPLHGRVRDADIRAIAACLAAAG